MNMPSTEDISLLYSSNDSKIRPISYIYYETYDAGRPQKITDRDKKLIKLRDDTLSLPDLVRYANTELSLSISCSTVSRILREHNLLSYIAPRKPQISSKQRHDRLECCYAHLNWSVKDWSPVIFSDESNYEGLNRKNRMYIRRFRIDRTGPYYCVPIVSLRLSTDSA